MILKLISTLALASGEQIFEEINDNGTDYTKPWLDYVRRPEEHYGWEELNKWQDWATGSHVWHLNVTSLQWKNNTVYDNPDVVGDGSIWRHDVLVIEPPVVKHRNTMLVWATGSCNSRKMTAPPCSFHGFDKELCAIELAAVQAEMIAVTINQLPNCHLVFTDDPDKKHRSEDSLLAYSMKMFLMGPEEVADPENYLIYPMAKAVLQTTKAAREFGIQKELVDEDVGFIVLGASKRG